MTFEADRNAMVEIANRKREVMEILIFFYNDKLNNFDKFAVDERTKMYQILIQNGLIGAEFLKFFNAIARRKTDLTLAVIRAIDLGLVDIETVRTEMSKDGGPKDGDLFYGDRFKNLVLAVAEHFPNYKKCVAE